MVAQRPDPPRGVVRGASSPEFGRAQLAMAAGGGIGGLGGFISGGVASAAFLGMDALPSIALIFGAVLMGAVAGGWVGSLWRRRILSREFTDLCSRGFLCCLACRYDLSRCRRGPCPECGADFDPETMRKSWAWTYHEWGDPIARSMGDL